MSSNMYRIAPTLLPPLPCSAISTGAAKTYRPVTCHRHRQRRAVRCDSSAAHGNWSAIVGYSYCDMCDIFCFILNKYHMKFQMLLPSSIINFVYLLEQIR